MASNGRTGSIPVRGTSIALSDIWEGDFFEFAPIWLQNFWGPSAKSGRNALGTPKNKGTECDFSVKVPAVPYVSQHLS